jgi:hypothetical protein
MQLPEKYKANFNVLSEGPIWVVLLGNNCLVPSPLALIKIFHTSHYIKGLHEVVHRDEQAQGFMGLDAHIHT